MSVLSNSELWRRIESNDDPLVLTPLLDPEQVGAASIDIRIGHQFIILQRSEVPHIDSSHSDELMNSLHRTQRKVRIQSKQKFVIHPRQLVLAATLEYVSMPKDLAAMVEGRSSWGRLGLIIATACSVAPGFKGCITLELVNDGEVPIILRPGMRIAQLVFFDSGKLADYLAGSPKYNCPTGPEFSKIHLDKETPFWA